MINQKESKNKELTMKRMMLLILRIQFYQKKKKSISVDSISSEISNL